VTVGLNKGEAKNSLSRAVCFHRRGMVQDRTFDDQRLRVGGLNLVVAAIVLWNTVYLERAVETLRARWDGRARRIAPASLALGLGTHHPDW
jgi:TnpA family transposase